MLKRSIVLGLSLALATVAASPEAFAKPKAAAQKKAKKAKKQAVLVGAFEGVRAEDTRRWVIEALNETEAYQVTDAEDLKPSSTKKEFAQMARDLMAEATIVGVISKKMNLTLTVYDKNGKKVGAVEIKGGTRKKLESGIQNELEIAIADPLAEAAGTAPAAAEPEPKAKAKAKPKAEPEEDAEEPAAEEPIAEEPTDDAGDETSEESSDEAASEPAEEAGGAGKRPLEAMLLIRGYNRKFNYTGQLTPGLAPYDLPMAPSFVVSARIYPAAFATDSAISHVGIMGKYELGLATTTIAKTTDPVAMTETKTTLKTQVNDLQVGLRARLPLGSVELGTFALYGRQQFLLLGDEVNPLVPDTTYGYLRIGIDGRVQLGKFTVDVQVAPRFLQTMNELDLAGVWFPGATGSGVDFGAMLGWNYLSWLDAVAGFELVRYGFDFNNIPDENPLVAGGATDTYLSAFLGARFHFDATASAEGGQVSAETTTEDATEPSADEPSSEE